MLCNKYETNTQVGMNWNYPLSWRFFTSLLMHWNTYLNRQILNFLYLSGHFLMSCSRPFKSRSAAVILSRLLWFLSWWRVSVLWYFQKILLCFGNIKYWEFWALKIFNVCMKYWLSVASVYISVGLNCESVFVLSSVLCEQSSST